VNVDPKRLTTIVFDVDGTLYRQGGLRRAMLLRLLRHAVSNPGAAIATFRVLRAYRRAQEHLRGVPVQGGLAAAQLRFACERSGQTEDVVAKIVAQWMDVEPLGLLRRFVEPALPGLLAAARRRGLRLGVLSDYPAAAKLEAMQLAEFFDVVVSAQDEAVNCFKPDPAGLAHVLRKLNAHPSQALYVGDRHEVDGAVARAAGVPCIIIGRRGRSTSSEAWLPVSDYGKLHSMLFPSTSEPIA
jgi:FMN phosphatase YigB (HAD superfamily)